MKIKQFFKIFFAVLFGAAVLLPVGAGAQSYGSFDECMQSTNYNDTECCKAFQAQNIGICLSGRTGSQSSDNASSQFCPPDKFDFINGLCVPRQNAGRPGSLLKTGSIFELVTALLTWLLTFAGIIATVFLIIGGYQYITAAGNEEQSEKGKKTILNAIIGIVVVVLSITIVTIITNSLGAGGPLG